MKELSPRGKLEIGQYISENPQDAANIINDLNARGYDFPDVTDYTKSSAATEIVSFLRHGVKGATLGLVEPRGLPGEAQIAGDIDLPIFGRVQPSAGFGELAGMLAPFSAGAKVGKAVAGRILPKLTPLETSIGGEVVKVAGDSKRRAGARFALEHTIGEGGTGGLQSLIETKGNLEEAVKTAAEWAAIGMITPVAFKWLKGGLEKMRNKAPLEEMEEAAVQKLGGRLESRLKKAARGEEILEPKLADAVAVDFHSLVKRVADGSLPPQEALTQAAAALPELLKPLGSAKAARVRNPILQVLADAMEASKAGSISAEDVTWELASVLQGKRAGTELNWLRPDGAKAAELFIGKSAPAKAAEMMGKLEERREELAAQIKSGLSTALFGVKKKALAKIDEQIQVLRKKMAPAAGEESAEGAAARTGAAGETAAAEGEAGASSIAGETTQGVLQGKKTGYSYQAGDEVLVTKTTGDEPFTGMLAGWSDGVVTIQTEQGARHIPIEDIKALKKIPKVSGGAEGPPSPDFAVPTKEALEEVAALEHELGHTGQFAAPPPRSGAEARLRIAALKQERAHRGAKAMDEFEGELNQARTSDMDVDDAISVSLKRGEEAVDYGQPGLAYQIGVGTPGSRFGLGANTNSAQSVDLVTQVNRNVEKTTAEILDQYLQILGELAPGAGQQIMGLISKPAKTAVDAGYKAKTLLARALDGDGEALRDAPELVPVYRQLRALLDELADRLGLARQDRISEYFPHLFNGKVGKWRAMRIAEEMGADGAFLRDNTGARIPSQKFFANLSQRTGAEGFNYDLDAALYAYIKGAVAKSEWDKVLPSLQRLFKNIPAKDAGGIPMTTRKLTAEYLQYAMGRPSDMRYTVTRFWRDNKLFNTGVDRLIEKLGGADPQLLAMARGNDPKAVAKTFEFFDRLVAEAAKYTREGEVANNPFSKKMRARLALQIDDLRAGLQNPYQRSVILSKVTKLMVINYLGGNLAHGLVNMTQVLTNSIPELTTKYVIKGISSWSGNQERKIGGRAISEILEESGIRASVPTSGEFTAGSSSSYSTLKHYMIDRALWPSNASEQFNRQVTLLGAYEKGIDEGMNHLAALSNAKKIVNKTQFDFSRAGTPPMMRSPMAQLLLLFQSFPMHQINFSAELLDDALKGKGMAPLVRHIGAYLGLAGLTAGLLGGTNLNERTQHPAIDLLDTARGEGKGRDPVLEAVTGPPAGILLDVLHGQYSSALKEATIPAAVRHASGGENLMQALGIAAALGGGGAAASMATAAVAP